MADRLQLELKTRPGQGSEQEGQRLEQLRQQLARVETAIRSVDCFLATVTEVEVTDNQTSPGWEQNDQAWQRLHSAAEQAENSLRAAGMTLATNGVTVTCRDVLTSLCRRACEIQECCGTRPDSTHEQRQLAKRSSLERDGDLNWIRQEKEKASKVSDGEGEKKGSGVSLHVRGDEGEKEGLIQTRLLLLVSLRETTEAAERLRWQEPSLPALQHRYHTGTSDKVLCHCVGRRISVASFINGNEISHIVAVAEQVVIYKTHCKLYLTDLVSK